MKYLLKIPQGAAYDYSLDEIRREFREGKLPVTCTVRKTNSKEWVSLRTLLEEVGDLEKIVPAQLTSATQSESRAQQPAAFSDDKALLSAIAALTDEVQMVRRECAKTTWAVRGVGFLIALIVMFGFKIIIR